MKSEKIRKYVIEIALVIFLLLSIIYNKVINKKMIAIVLLVFMFISDKVIKNTRTKYTNNKEMIAILSILGVSYVAILYLIGFLTNFYAATIKISVWSVVNYIIPYIVIMVSTELIRKTILLKESKNTDKVIITIITTMIDLTLNVNIQSVTTIKEYFTIITFTIIASIASNMLYNYIIIKYRNAGANIAYKLITTMYMFVFPILPNIYVFLETVLRIIIPYIIYIILEAMYSKNTEVITVKERKKEKIISVISITIIIVIVMLVSGQFKIGVLVIGSGSMTGTINKGDIIIYERYGKTEEIKTGDIIVFNSENIKIVHRIIDQRLLGEETRYYTKGDANQKEDEGYRLDKDIIGQVKFRIPSIGYLTLWINDMIKGE